MKDMPKVSQNSIATYAVRALTLLKALESARAFFGKRVSLISLQKGLLQEASYTRQ